MDTNETSQKQQGTAESLNTKVEREILQYKRTIDNMRIMFEARSH